MEGASGFMVSAPSPRRRHYVVFLGKTLYSAHSSSLQPGVWLDTGKFNAEGNPAMDWHPIQGIVEILLVAETELLTSNDMIFFAQFEHRPH